MAKIRQIWSQWMRPKQTFPQCQKHTLSEPIHPPTHCFRQSCVTRHNIFRKLFICICFGGLLLMYLSLSLSLSISFSLSLFLSLSLSLFLSFSFSLFLYLFLSLSLCPVQSWIEIFCFSTWLWIFLFDVNHSIYLNCPTWRHGQDVTRLAFLFLSQFSQTKLDLICIISTVWPNNGDVCSKWNLNCIINVNIIGRYLIQATS